MIGRVVALLALGLVFGTAMPVSAGDHTGRKVLFVDSYDETLRWSQDLAKAITQTLEPHGIEVRVHRMDTKRQPSAAYKERAGAEAKALVEEFEPDVLIATDDNAQIHLVVPNYVGSQLPVVFAGVNADPATYGYPAANVTGMQEVNPMGGLVDLLSAVSGGSRIGYLALDNETERAQLEVSMAQVSQPVDAVFVKSFDDWKRAFLDLGARTDFILVGPIHGLQGVDPAAAQAFLIENMSVPTGGWQAMMRDFTLLTLEKTGTEQGLWAAEAALRILSGTRPGDIPITQNTRGKMAINAKIADAIGMAVPAELFELADVIVE